MIKATLKKKAFNWGLAYSFRGLVSYHGRECRRHVGRHGAGKRVAKSSDLQASGRRDTEPAMGTENLTSRGNLPLTRPQFLFP